jgi:hypothetical protein
MEPSNLITALIRHAPLRHVEAIPLIKCMRAAVPAPRPGLQIPPRPGIPTECLGDVSLEVKAL